jgi:hypothetical protein
MTGRGHWTIRISYPETVFPAAEMLPGIGRVGRHEPWWNSLLGLWGEK